MHLGCRIQSCVLRLQKFSFMCLLLLKFYACWDTFPDCNYHSIPLSLRYFRIPILFWWLEEDKGGWVNLFCITQIDHGSILLKCLDLSWIVLGDDVAAFWCVFAGERLLSVRTSRSADAAAVFCQGDMQGDKVCSSWRLIFKTCWRLT